nr:GMC oxidoreductase [Actinopolymorpha pittospori]
MSDVDSELHLHGIQVLRVADGSIMRSIVTGSPSPTVYGLAERAAELTAS